MIDEDRACVTVVIPVWGPYTGRWLDEAIASIAGQAPPTAILLVDNAHEPPVQRPGVSVVRTAERLSVGAARDVGLQLVRTPAVVMWDADDVMLPGTLARLLSRLDADPAIVACSPGIVDYEDGSHHGWPRRWPLALTRFPHAFALLNAATSLYPVIGAALNTQAAQDVGFPDADIGDDWAVGTSLAFRGRIAVDPLPGRRYRAHSGSVSSGWTRGEVLAGAATVRRHLRSDTSAPIYVRGAVPLIAAAQHAVLRALRPLRHHGRRAARRF